MKKITTFNLMKSFTSERLREMASRVDFTVHPFLRSNGEWITAVAGDIALADYVYVGLKKQDAVAGKYGLVRL